MGNTITIDANRQELWSKTLMQDIKRDIDNVMRFTTESTTGNGILHMSRDLAKKKGDLQNFGLVTRLSGDGVTGGNELEGNEQPMSSYNEQVAIDQIRQGVRTDGKLDAQKVTYSEIETGREMLRIWMKEYIARQIFLKAGGVTNTTLVDTEGVAYSVRATWSNTPTFIPDADTAYTGTRYRYMNAGGVTAASLASTDTMTLDVVTDAVTKAKLSNPRIQMIESGGDSFYVMYLHPLCARDIRKSSDWKTAQQDAQTRGDRNPVFRGALGFWSNCLLLENEYVPWLDVSEAGNSFRGASSGTNFAVDTARNLLMGKQAVVMAEVKNTNALVLEKFDYGDQDGAAIELIGGIQKTMFNSKEFGVLAVDAAAAV